MEIGWKLTHELEVLEIGPIQALAMLKIRHY